jgi:RNA polymerase sigma factor (sigma-70 family)
VHAYADPRSSARDRAFERLYRRYVKDVYRYTLALLRNPADAEDITQTTFLNAYRAYQRGEEPLKPQNWLIKIAHNACRTRYLRASRRPQEVPLEDSLRQLSVPADEIPDVKEVLDALAQLPFNQRAALVMRELEGRSYTEISHALDVSVPAVETLIFRARRALRIRRSALRTLVALPLPSSLSSFSGGGAVVGGGALVGSGLLLKAALAVGVGIVAGGVGTTVEAKILAPKAGAESLPHSQPLLDTSGLAAAGSTSSLAPSIAVRKAGQGAAGAVVAAGEKGRRAPGELPRRGGDASSVPAERTAGAVTPAAAAAPSTALPASPPSSPAAVVDTVTETLPAPPAVVPPVAVPPVPALPSLPPPPLEPPALPPPPPLPPPPTLP